MKNFARYFSTISILNVRKGWGNMKWNVLNEALLSLADPFNASFNLYLFFQENHFLIILWKFIGKKILEYFWTIETKTRFRLNLWIECSGNIHRVKVYSHIEETLLIFEIILINWALCYAVRGYFIYRQPRFVSRTMFHVIIKMTSLTSSNTVNKLYHCKGICPTESLKTD